MMPNPAMTFARALIAHLAANDVADIVLCPGSRSGPLAHALAEATADLRPAGAPQVRLHVRIDERSAGFLALGLGIARGAAAVVTTSGTAVGNLLPAVMEAHHSGIRLLAITADRPFDLRGTGANQTTDQRGIFGPFVRLSLDVLAPGHGVDLEAQAASIVAKAVIHASGAAGRTDLLAGPVHLNLQFRDPLGSDRGAWPAAEAAEFGFPPEPAAPPLPDLERGVVIAGDRAGPAAATIAHLQGWPLLAEPSSGARSGDSAVPRYAALLAGESGEELAREAEFVLQVGRPTLSRAVRRLIDEAPMLWVARAGAPWTETPTNAAVVVPDVPFGWVRGSRAADRSSWLARWHEAAPDEGSPVWGLDGVARVICDAVGDGTLVVGSSGAIRAVDAALSARPAGSGRRVIANRGLAGIDGTLSTAAGVSLGLGVPVTAFVGDLTFLHDVGGLLVGPREVRPNLRIVIANDGGGTIFGRLEHASVDPRLFERVFTTPHGVDLRAVCEAYGATHMAARSLEELRAALKSEPVGIEAVEAHLG